MKKCFFLTLSLLFATLVNAQLSSTETEINVSTLPKGVYFISISIENQTFIEKIVIE